MQQTDQSPSNVISGLPPITQSQWQFSRNKHSPQNTLALVWYNQFKGVPDKLMVLLNMVHCERQHAAVISRGEGEFRGQVASKDILQPAVCAHLCRGSLGSGSVLCFCACEQFRAQRSCGPQTLQMDQIPCLHPCALQSPLNTVHSGRNAS